MLRALRMCKHLRDQRLAHTALGDFLKALDPSWLTIPIAEIQQRVVMPGRSVLMVSRVRLDTTCMLLARLSHARLRASKTPVSFHILADASPQFKATELFGAWLDTCSLSTLDIKRRQLPLCTLGFKHMHLSDKIFAVLWMALLEFGPDIVSLRHFCNNVRSVTTDMGTESGLCDLPDVLPEFLQLVVGRRISEEPGTVGCKWGTDFWWQGKYIGF